MSLMMIQESRKRLCKCQKKNLFFLWHCCVLLILEPMVSRLVILEGIIFVKIALL
jgi:hypothetical protein